MKLPFRIEWTTPRRLAAAAFVLGAVALAGDPVRGHVVSVDTQELALLAARGADLMAPADLAGRVVAGAKDYRLVDLREPAAFAAYHIPTSENVPLARLMQAGLARNERIVLVADDGLRAAQAWMLLHAQGYRGVRMLARGLEGWRDEVVYPAVPAAPTAEEAARFERASQLAQYFGGHPREAGAGGGGAYTLSQVSPRPQPAAAPAPVPGAVVPVAGPAKTKEGC